MAVLLLVTGLVAGLGAVATTPAVAAEDVSRPPAESTSGARPLAHYFDNAGISDDSAPGAADLDGSGRSLSAQALAAAGWSPGARLTVHATALTWPDTRPGRPDNAIADGQRVQVSGRGDAVTFLVAGTGGPATGTGRIGYRDGTRAAYTLTAPDWDTGPLATKAVALPYGNTPGGQRSGPVRLYAVTVPVDRARPVAHVELPRVADPAARLHVFAVALRHGTGWTGSWSASTSGYAPVGPWEDQTLRLAVRATSGGPAVRLRLDNTFAARPVAIGRVTVALRSSGAAARTTPVPVSFGGAEEVRIPAGGQARSDAVALRIPAGAELLVSMHLPEPVAAAPVHTAATGTNYGTAAGTGDHTGDASGAAFTERVTVWPFLTGIDVVGGPGSVVALGDSITDGVGSTSGANRRWPDVLADRLAAQSAVPRYGILNQGISANRVASDRYTGDGVSTDTGGVSARNRLDRDVLAQTGAHTVVVFEGVNDVRWGASSADVIAGLRDIAARSRAHGLRVLVATIAPCGGYRDCTADVDARRQEVNAFIRDNGGTFDGVLDFDAVLRDPADPARLLPAYDSGDHLHPGDAGLRAVAESIDLDLLRPDAAP
ncbi:G-D-S-L family lipolytic protein [Marinitenerispora sediminis]|uniref:G-D-S-L family lipolytic protein n=1 Tax=Marinitenerispora sediminis TaxID=1931232 RepID=A0A368T947_9ACTN|nr:G-D-S-L family lipolytic protein [Marinitenerispora sediminis]RCV58027.1 G-D-S-L family lipolytic protein [Marinitenerispora sediminis]RCV60708.1 G-D-S-L family lipolytic protein [Marinitenerispora sediminis]